MTDFRELKELDYEDSAIYRRTNGDVVQITRVDEKPPVRQWDGLSNTVYDFVHGYIEDQEVYNMKTLYQSLDNQELISIVSASGRDMTADTRLYLSARDYYDHLVALKAPQEALDAQQEIANVYLDHLKAYGDACVVMCKKILLLPTLISTVLPKPVFVHPLTEWMRWRKARSMSCVIIRQRTYASN